MPYFDKNKDRRKKHCYFRNRNVVFIFTEKWHNNSIDKKERQW